MVRTLMMNHVAHSNQCRQVMCIAVVMCLHASALAGNIYNVGPGQPYANFQALPDLSAGDLVLVDGGGAVYPGNINFFDEGHGTAAEPIVLRGVVIKNQRPIISGGTNCIRLDNDYYWLENFEVTEGTSRGIYTAGHGNVIRNCVVHDCANHGILGGDGGSGDLLIEYTEVHHCGNGLSNHQIYVATDNDEHPTAIFRMQFCYIHHGNGGNNVKSRCGRNEIYYNWIEGAFYHELECIGADPAGQTTPPETVREDSDIVGNILVKTNGTGLICRVGGDGTGASDGRYRFVNNTCVMFSGTQAVFRYQDIMESMECHNNAFLRAAGGGVRIYSDSLSEPISSVAFAGTNNWIPTGSTFVPSQWTGTIVGSAPGMADAAGFDFTPTVGGAIINAGNPSPATIPAHPFLSALFPPAYHPPPRTLIAVGMAQARPVNGIIDIGALEYAPMIPCPADVTGNEVVDIDDLLAVINAWGSAGSTPADITGNGVVNVDDLLAVINAWGPC
jgi:hypothetical protein